MQKVMMTEHDWTTATLNLGEEDTACPAGHINRVNKEQLPEAGLVVTSRWGCPSVCIWKRQLAYRINSEAGRRESLLCWGPSEARLVQMIKGTELFPSGWMTYLFQRSKLTVRLLGPCDAQDIRMKSFGFIIQLESLDFCDWPGEHLSN